VDSLDLSREFKNKCINSVLNEDTSVLGIFSVSSVMTSDR